MNRVALGDLNKSWWKDWSSAKDTILLQLTKGKARKLTHSILAGYPTCSARLAHLDDAGTVVEPRRCWLRRLSCGSGQARRVCALAIEKGAKILANILRIQMTSGLCILFQAIGQLKLLGQSKTKHLKFTKSGKSALSEKDKLASRWCAAETRRCQVAIRAANTWSEEGVRWSTELTLC